MNKMNEKFRKEIIALYEEVMKKTCSNDRKKDISTLLYSNSVNEFESIVKKLSMKYVPIALYFDIPAESFLNKGQKTLTTLSNINGTFIFGDNEVFNDITNTHYKFIKSGCAFVIIRDGSIINYLINDNDEYSWLYKEVKDSFFCNEFDFISNDQKQKIVESIKSMYVLNKLYKN